MTAVPPPLAHTTYPVNRIVSATSVRKSCVGTAPHLIRFIASVRLALFVGTG